MSGGMVMSQPLQDTLQGMQERISTLPSMNIDSLPPGKTLSISVDLNNGFAKKGALYSPRVEALIPKTVSFVKRCRELCIPIIALTDCHGEDSPEFVGFPPHCLDGTDETLVVEEIRNLVDRIIPKNSTNGFYRLQEQGIIDKYTNFIITGCCTDICIFQLATAIKTWFNEKNASCRVIVPASLVDTYDAPGHDAQLLNAVFFSNMLSAGIEVVRDVQ